MKTLIGFLALAALVPLSFASYGAIQAESPERPHIVLIVADDLGWNDVSYNGSTIPTPHIDALAASGARLDRFYVQPSCSPTRAAILTGRYPLRYGLTQILQPWASYGLDLDERLLPEVLGEAGYRTVMCGKWHLGHARPEFLPTERGFAHHYGLYTGGMDYFTHERYDGLDWHRNREGVREAGYATDLLAEEAESIIAAHESSQPLFLYLPFTAPHAPKQAPERWLARSATAPGRDRTFAAMVRCLDEAVGRVVKALEKRGLREDTLLFFLSDNGGSPKLGASNAPLRGGKRTPYEGGVRVPALVSWPGVVEPETRIDASLHAVDILPTLTRRALGTLEGGRPLDGIDIWQLVLGEAPASERTLLIDSSPTEGVLKRGRWKLVCKFDSAGRAHGKELFDLHEDPSETRNVVTGQPKIAAELLEALESLRSEAAPTLSAKRPRNFRGPEVWGPDPMKPGTTKR